MAKLLLGAYVLATSIALILLKLGSKDTSPISLVDSKISLNFNYYIISAIFLYGLSFLTYTYLIARYDLGYIIPVVTALVYVIIFLASFFLFKETFTPLKITGIALIMLGIIMLNLQK